MAFDMYMELKGIDGETSDDKMKKQKAMDVLAWNWGISQSGSMHLGGGGGSGKAHFQDISFTKWVDRATPILMLHCGTGKHITEGKLTVRKAGDDPMVYLEIEMKKIIVSSISTGGSGGEDKLTEIVTLNFAEQRTYYYPQKDDGTQDKAIEFGYNIKDNKNTT